MEEVRSQMDGKEQERADRCQRAQQWGQNVEAEVDTCRAQRFWRKVMAVLRAELEFCIKCYEV